MRLQDGIIVNNEHTFGVMKFSALRREKMKQKEDGSASDEVKERVYDLRCKIQGCMIQVGISPEAEEKEFSPGTEVVLVNPRVGAVATPTFGNNAEIDWYVKADDVVPYKEVKRPVPNRPQQPTTQEAAKQ